MKIYNNKVNAILSILDQGLYSLSSLTVAVILGRYSEQSVFGLFILLNSIWLLIYTLQVGFVNHALLVLKNTEDVDFFEAMPTIQLLIGCFIFMSLNFFGIFFQYWISMLGFFDVFFFSIFVFTQILREFVRIHNIASHHYTVVILYDGVFLLLLVSVLFGSAILGQISLNLVWVSIASCAFGVFLADSWISRFTITFELEKLIRNFKILFKYSKWNVLSSFLYWCSDNLYKYIILAFLDLKAIAAIGACQYILNLTNPILNGLQVFSLGFLAKARFKSKIFKRRYKKITILIFSVAVLYGSLMILFPKILLTIFYDDEYTSYYWVLQAFGISYVFGIINRVLSIKLLVLRLTYFLFQFNTISMILSTGLLVILMYLYGFRGFIGFQIGSAIIDSLLCVVYFVRIDKIGTITNNQV